MRERVSQLVFEESRGLLETGKTNCEKGTPEPFLKEMGRLWAVNQGGTAGDNSRPWIIPGREFFYVYIVRED